ncbi:MAG: TrkH family potassium uptake protein [Clostridia bacterium]|nr:TrkH family potassium uptake protein [Clostridia bacterium]MBP5271049.1 TrkH family potassium uptake protein [Clostridia bacterium]
MIFYVVGFIVAAEGALLLLPALTALIFLEKEGLAYLAVAAGCGVLGAALILSCRTSAHTIYAGEGFAIVALGWIVMSAAGALPFVITGEIPGYVDALFETVSGFTTTGASIVENVGTLSHASIFWRSFTHFVGGMGVLIFIMAVIPNIADRSINIMRAEMPGPVVGKLVPRVRQTAGILYVIYVVMTLTEMVLLAAGGMPFFDCLCYSLGTAGTGGFSATPEGIVTPYSQWVVTVFMMLFGVNFNLYYLIIAGKIRTALSSLELWVYLGMILVAGSFITFMILPSYGGFGEAVRHAFFQTVSISTTTGYSTADFDKWPMVCRTTLLILMCFGGCAGSTAGGLKISRVILGLRSLGAQIKRLIHPRAVANVRFEGRPVDPGTLTGVSVYFILYVCTLAVTFFLLSFDRLGMTENISAAVACMNNIGPGLGLIGPASNYSAFSGFSKIVLSVAMLAGRLEFYPLLIAFLPATWRKK